MPEVFNGHPDKGGFSAGSAADFSESLIHSAIEDPVNGIAGLCHKEVHMTGEYNHDSLAAKGGQVVGMAADFIGLSKAADLVPGVAGLSATTGGSALKMAGLGGIYGGLLTPGADRLKTAAVDGLTFAAMGGISKALEPEAGASRTFRMEVKNGAISGAAGGLVNTEASSVVNGKGISFDPRELGANAAKYAAFGALFAGGGHLLDRARPAAANSDGNPNPQGFASFDDATEQHSVESNSAGTQAVVGNEVVQSGNPAARPNVAIESAQTGNPVSLPNVAIEGEAAQHVGTKEFDLTQPWTEDPHILKAQEYEAATVPPTLRDRPAVQAFPTHEGTTDTDVLVIGGGVAGLMAGARLASDGANVSLVDGSTIASGTTARGTAMFTRDPDVSQSDYAEMHGDEEAQAHLQRLDAAQKAVIDIAQKADTFNGQGSYRISYDPDDEYALADKAVFDKLNPDSAVRILRGEDAANETGVPSAQTALAFDGEGSADPREVAKIMADTPGLQVYENSPVVGLTVPEDGGTVEAHLANGSVIHANRVVFATGGTSAPFSYLNDYLSGEQCFAGRATIRADQAPTGNVFDGGIEGIQRSDDDYNYYRLQSGAEAPPTPAGQAQLLFGADSHFLADEPPVKTTRVLNQALNHLFPGARVNARWQGTIFDTADGAPIVAQHPELPQLYSITGLGGTGWVNSALAADDLAGRIVEGKETGPYAPERLDNIQQTEEEG